MEFLKENKILICTCILNMCVFLVCAAGAGYSYQKGYGFLTIASVLIGIIFFAVFVASSALIDTAVRDYNDKKKYGPIQDNL